MLRKGAEVTRRNQGSTQRLGGFHGAIIASWILALALSGCGYKTDPVYVGPAHHTPVATGDGAD